MKPTAKERNFWRVVAIALGLILLAGVVANSIRAGTIPFGILLLVFGSLLAIAVGSAIVNPKSSPAILTKHEEMRFRRGQFTVSVVFSLIVGILLVLTDLRESALASLFVPIVVMPLVLLLRAILLGDVRIPTFVFSLVEIAMVCALLLSLAFYGRNHFEAGNARHDLARLLVFACIFGGAFIVEHRLYAWLQTGNSQSGQKEVDLRRRWRLRFYIAGYGVLILSAISLILIISL